MNCTNFFYHFYLAVSHVKKVTLLGLFRSQSECHVQVVDNLFSVSTAKKLKICTAAKKTDLRD